MVATWDTLETSLASVAPGFTLREGLVPASAPQATIPLVQHGDVADGVVFYRDTNAWCPFCERVYLYLLEAAIEHEQTFVDISPGNKPDWYKEVIPTGQTPSLSLGGKPVWESNEIITALEAALSSGAVSGKSMLPHAAADRERVLAELGTLDDPKAGLKVGSAGYVYSACASLDPGTCRLPLATELAQRSLNRDPCAQCAALHSASSRLPTAPTSPLSVRPSSTRSGLSRPG